MTCLISSRRRWNRSIISSMLSLFSAAVAGLLRSPGVFPRPSMRNISASSSPSPPMVGAVVMHDRRTCQSALKLWAAVTSYEGAAAPAEPELSCPCDWKRGCTSSTKYCSRTPAIGGGSLGSSCSWCWGPPPAVRWAGSRICRLRQAASVMMSESSSAKM